MYIIMYIIIYIILLEASDSERILYVYYIC
nr:MAG TPA: hypothetical protein [Bacteriophage sp.]